MFASLLIANRGEIACRVIRTARALGIRTVAVYSDADRDAMHVSMADEAVRIGPAPAAESYLRIDALLAAAAAGGAEAVHPGYGFLAENAGFAQACEDAGLVFVGPPAGVIRLMGDKRAASLAMAESGVPVLSGYRGEAQDGAALRRAVDEIGLPVMIKPSAGGGGKGMHVVTEKAGLAAALDRARSEAGAAFGDDTLVLERYLERPRHVEVQVFADAHGGVVHLHERECSLQRRHQKVMEECPAPGLAPQTRSRLCDTAVIAAKAVGYRGAGTVEFLLDADTPGQPFYFMEMNTRLQVEHAVTEMVTGLDLVEWQLRVAAGAPLPLEQRAIAPRGHAIEARICAEDPARGFLPATGEITRFEAPVAANAAAGGDSPLRLDAGVRAGDAVSIYYDSLLAKLVALGDERSAALRRLREALQATRVEGVASNLTLLRALTLDERMLAGEQDTGLVERELGPLLQSAAGSLAAGDPLLLAVAAAWRLERDADASRASAARSGDPHSPWGRLTGWRLNGPAQEALRACLEGPDGAPGDAVTLAVRPGEAGYAITVAGETLNMRVIRRPACAVEPDDWRMEVARASGAVQLDAAIQPVGPEGVLVRVRNGAARLRFLSRDARSARGAATAGHLLAPMPGRIARVLVGVGDAVDAGQALLVLEAMKMEHTIVAPSAGEVSGLRFAPGDLVAEGEELVTVSPAGTDAD